MSAVDAAAAKSLKPMRDETARTYLPHRQASTPNGEHLDQNIVVRKETSGRTRRQYRIGANRKARWYAHLVEFGTAAHYQPNRGVLHPGARPVFGLTRAYEANGNDVIDSMGVFLREIILRRAVSSINRRSRR